MPAKKPQTKRTSAKPAPQLSPRDLALVRSAVRSFYTFAEPFNSAGGRKRRPAHVERGPEEESPQLSPRNRLGGVNLARDLMRNSAQVRGLARTIRVNTIGDCGQLVFADAEGDWFAAAADYFNHRWGRHADFIDGTTWRETLQLVVYSLAFEGDCVAVFDDGLLSPRLPAEKRGTGRLAFFEADQIANLREADFAEWTKRTGREGWHQCSGVVLDDLGRKRGVIVSRHRGETEIAYKDALVLLLDPDDPDAAPWRHVTRKFRLRQLRGSADALPSIATVQDALEMTDYELQSAKRAASHYAAAIAKDAPVQPVDMAALPRPEDLAQAVADNAAASAPDPATAAAPLPPGAVDDDADSGASRSNLARLSGGQFDLWDGIEKIEWDPATRPSDRVVEFLEYATRLAGRAHGLNASYASGKAEGSYTAFRGDLTMSWCAFRDNQQALEDCFSDWVARHVLGRAIELGEIKGTPPDGWETRIRWTYPRMPAVDEEKEQRALLAALRNGTRTLRDELGPAWRDVLRQRNAEREFCASLGLSLAQDEITPGSAVAAPAATPNTPDPQ
jgi:capsid protein